MTAPAGEVGSVEAVPGWAAFAGATTDSADPPAWQGPNRVVTVNRMRADAQVDSLTNSVAMPVMRMEWRLNPNGARDEVVEHISTDTGIPIKGNNDPAPRSRRRFKHRDHLEHALLAPWYGHMFFEMVPDTERFDLATDGWRLRKLAPRMPSSIDKIHVAPDGGLAGITQYGYRPPVTARRRGLSLLQTATPQIPVSSLAAYVWKREGANWLGRSMLRPLYGPWALKDRALRVDALKNERFGMGIPVASTPEGGDPNEAARLAQAMRASEYGGVGLKPGQTVGVEGIRGTLPDVLASIRYYDESMARAFMAMVVQLGQTQTGSRALGETFADFFQMLTESVANWYRDTTNEHVIEDLVDWNWGEDEQAPLLEWAYPQGESALAISDLVSMVDSGIVTMDAETERAVRSQTRLPMLPEGFVRPEREVVEATSVTVREGVRKKTPKITVASSPASRLPFEVADSRDVSAGKQMIGDPVVGHRPPNAFELAAKTDFAEIQERWQDATADLVSTWRSEIQTVQIDSLVDQVRLAWTNGDVPALAKIQAPVVGTDLIENSMMEMAEDAVVGAKAEAAAQGVKMGIIDLDEAVKPLVVARAEGTSNLLARGISDSASRVAINLAAEAVSPDEVAAAVREHLEGLTDAYLNDMLGGAMTQAQNTGRRAVMTEKPAQIYASELLDGATCVNCEGVDEKEYDSLSDAEADYPTGGYKSCLGGPRCRGTLVAVYTEGDAEPPPPPPPAVSEPDEPEPDEPSLFNPQELSDMLSPSRSRTKAAILKDLESTPQGKDLAASIKGFTETRGGVANLRNNIEKYRSGEASDTVAARVNAFLDAVDAYPVDEVPELYRGVAVKVTENTSAWWDEFEAQFQPGQTLEMNASSFSSKQSKAAEFERMIGGTKKASNNYTALRFVLQEEAHALPVEMVSKFKSEKEWITGGEFEVVEFAPATKQQPYTRVVLKQTKGLK